MKTCNRHDIAFIDFECPACLLEGELEKAKETIEEFQIILDK